MSPEFFLDRNLGRRVAEGLRACGWTVHRIGDAFPDDGQDIPDEDRIAYGLDRSWVPLSKDERLVVCRDAIHRAVEEGGPAAYAVRQDRIERTWPWRTGGPGTDARPHCSTPVPPLAGTGAEHCGRGWQAGRAVAVCAVILTGESGEEEVLVFVRRVKAQVRRIR